MSDGTAVDSAALTITTPAGSQVRISVTGNSRIMQCKAVTLEDIRPNYLRLPDGTAVIAVPREAEVLRLTLIRSPI